MRDEDRCDGGVEGSVDASSLAVALPAAGLDPDGAVGTERDHVPERGDAAVEVEVLPFQGEHPPAALPGRRRHHEEHDELRVLLGELEQPDDVAGRGRRDVVRARFAGVGVLGRVPGDETPANGLLERGAHDDVGPDDRGVGQGSAPAVLASAGALLDASTAEPAVVAEGGVELVEDRCAGAAAEAIERDERQGAEAAVDDPPRLALPGRDHAGPGDGEPLLEEVAELDAGGADGLAVDLDGVGVHGALRFPFRHHGPDGLRLVPLPAGERVAAGVRPELPHTGAALASVASHYSRRRMRLSARWEWRRTSRRPTAPGPRATARASPRSLRPRNSRRSIDAGYITVPDIPQGPVE